VTNDTGWVVSPVIDAQADKNIKKKITNNDLNFLERNFKSYFVSNVMRF
jgi:hypothetical protein